MVRHTSWVVVMLRWRFSRKKMTWMACCETMSVVGVSPARLLASQALHEPVAFQSPTPLHREVGPSYTPSNRVGKWSRQGRVRNPAEMEGHVFSLFQYVSSGRRFELARSDVLAEKNDSGAGSECGNGEA